MQNKGYYDSSRWLNTRKPVTPKLVMETVICNNCNSTWKEEMILPTAIVGYAKRYDYCSLCEQQYTSRSFKGKNSPTLSSSTEGLIPKDKFKYGNINIGIKSANIDPTRGEII